VKHVAHPVLTRVGYGCLRMERAVNALRWACKSHESALFACPELSETLQLQ
jgi:hypothetical protein